MRNYDRINALPPERITEKRAHIIGGGIAGLSAAAFLATDAHMPASHITIYESLPLMGGAMDAAGDVAGGYTSRGERELESYMECLWYLCSKVPSLQTPGLTVLDETHQANVREPIRSHFRLMEKQGQLYDYSGPLMSAHDARRMMELQLAPEADLEMMTVTDWFSPAFFHSVFWLTWASKLAFREYHSLIEVRRYVQRFMMMDYVLPQSVGILHTEFNEYDSIIKPLHVWLESLGVRFRTGTTVTDIAIRDTGVETLATHLMLRDAAGEHCIDLARDDLVFFTNGSLTQNATMGDTHTAPKFDRGTTDRGCFTVWEKLAARDAKFGHPAAFLSSVEASNWISYFPTITGDATFTAFMEAKTGDTAGTGGAITIVDSAWGISFVPYSKYFPDQPADVHVLWGYGQISDVPGDFVRKPMRDCTGAEMFAEVLYHCGLSDKIDSILAHTSVSTCMMPYITSQFMPRKISDRPKVIPDGCVNLAFIGQFVELPGDVVFTVETSVRTAMMAVWGLTGLDKPLIPMHEPAYDVRVIVASIKETLGIDAITPANIKDIAAASPALPDLLAFVNALPEPVV
ncbi:oleate hydratase [Novosphingobium sp.]|uniref:oleate hydratase n=1 Tax=Novosphingobium sp. TaxID=1874826 RepID=UPI003342359B